MADWGAADSSAWVSGPGTNTWEDTNKGGGDNEWDTGTSGGGFDDGFGAANANENGGKPEGERTCFNCGEAGHSKFDCPNPRVLSGACRRCGEEGHWSKDCPTAGPMTCNECGSEEHMVKDCPERKCKNCGQTGHTISKCEGARFVDRSEYADMSTEDAWEAIKKAAKARDTDEVKKAVQSYVKANPDATYDQLEEAFRLQDIKVWLIAIEKDLMSIYTNMDLQGNLDKKYTVTYRFQWNPPRPIDRKVWPKDVDENLERLKDAGEVVPRGIPICRNCSELGHISKNCPQEKYEADTVKVVKCFNCDGVGHRVRDCPKPRVDKFACKNCGQSGHKVAECPEPPNADNVECRKCNEMGHFSRDCPQGGGSRGCRNCGQEGHMARECTEPRNMATMQCRNCDEYGHMGKECPKPRDISRVKCSNCQEMGHFQSKCPNPPAGGDDNENGDFDNSGGGGGDNNGDDWGSGGGSAAADDTWGSGNVAKDW
ncbi:hypothetical protein QBC46DRAFT_309557 [Diplogelasinospora grovesii]|uniref:CCHC-type domain-containing protein n=1 Tax=Diplogelasinospora grovesii TaxID=303347 RepID=A0AAN6S6G6_9PEZI|nr:hypothetical protein QBC46DRAFT_309557 [Diplogelasinospora grovesii]